MTLTDEQLKEEIKKVEVKKTKPKMWDTYVKKRYLSWNITQEGNDLMVEFFQTIGEGPISLDAWYGGIKQIRKAISEAGFVLVKNKRLCKYMLFPKKTDPITSSFTFNPDMLDMENVEESDGDVKVEAEQSV